MEKLVNSFCKIARLVVVICLFVLAAFEIVALFNAIGNGPFMTSVYQILRTVLLLLLYLVPAILLITKNDKGGFVVLAFLLGYLVLAGALGFLAYAEGINGNLPALAVVRNIIGFVLGVLFAITICFFLIDKGFGTKLMKLGNFLLVVSLIVMLILIIIHMIYVLVEGLNFGDFVRSLAFELLTPLIIVFGLLLVGNEK
ncbi:MAG: hypothetical protein J5666_03780 [Bacilli bacterium]|nr:hypothetical protein [Bacilli bacterium]